ncbi:SpoIIE family protein phosphatase [Streptomyces sp. NPDC020951]|uniref:ATP-binding SpoIIE family protein phosphatase n=1 Tax=Streptomyces sp. NPDC020951 TaxID=3365104 RepID=UPI0037B19E9F
MEQQRTPGVEQPGLPDDVFEEARTARATVDEHGIVTEWSEGARRLLGYPPDEIIGKSAAHLLDEEVTGETLRGIQALPRWNGRVPLRHRNGRRVEVGLLVHHPVEGDAHHDWLLVSPLTGTAPAPEDEPLVAWSFQQSTCCAMGLYDTRLRLRRTNRYRERILDLTEAEMRGLRHSETLGHPEAERVERAMVRALKTGEPQYEEVYLRLLGEPREHAWSIFLSPLRDDDDVVRGVCLSVHDMTEQYSARKRLQLLNDAGTRIGSTLDVVRTAQELADVAVPEFADFATVDLLPTPHSAGDAAPWHADLGPIAAGPVRLRRAAQQSVLVGIPEAVVPLGEVDAYAANSPTAQALATGRATLRAEYDPQAADFSLGDPRREAAVRAFGIHSLIAVPLRARDTTLGVAVFARHQRPESFGEDDLLLAEELTARAAVCIDNARRYTQERDTAVALQKTLLPQQLPQQAAVDVAWRYLPTGALAGAGGDWFDVIPLPSARVALVVGDVVGHGIQASATMGRLRTAVRTLADLDLAPDELLTHLDDLVVRLVADACSDDSAPDQAAETAGGLGTTCLYAVYDPVSRVCTLARAGHPMPALVSPDGTVNFLDVPAGPPLGLGGLPFEAAQVTLPEDSVLALYTDGLIESRGQDIDQGLARLRRVLARPTPDLDGLCDAVLGALPPEHRTDDIVLLLARTHALDARQVATWDLPADPAVVAQARRLVTAQLSAWNLTEASFVTELVASELVTNAIRHADPPIQLRLIHDRHLICEVSDASSTAPHLRRARTYDEGGRGLLLVAQLTRGWGTRHTGTGKTIWAEQSLDAPQPGN